MIDVHKSVPDVSVDVISVRDGDSCRDIQELVVGHFLCEITAEETQRLDVHLSSCSCCRRRFRTLEYSGLNL